MYNKLNLFLSKEEESSFLTDKIDFSIILFEIIKHNNTINIITNNTNTLSLPPNSYFTPYNQPILDFPIYEITTKNNNYNLSSPTNLLTKIYEKAQQSPDFRFQLLFQKLKSAEQSSKLLSSQYFLKKRDPQNIKKSLLLSQNTLNKDIYSISKLDTAIFEKEMENVLNLYQSQVYRATIRLQIDKNYQTFFDSIFSELENEFKSIKYKQIPQFTTTFTKGFFSEYYFLINDFFLQKNLSFPIPKLCKIFDYHNYYILPFTTDWAKTQSASRYFNIGKLLTNEDCYIDTNTILHSLFLGASGSGKSVLFYQFLLNQIEKSLKLRKQGDIGDCFIVFDVNFDTANDLHRLLINKNEPELEINFINPFLSNSFPYRLNPLINPLWLEIDPQAYTLEDFEVNSLEKQVTDTFSTIKSPFSESSFGPRNSSLIKSSIRVITAINLLYILNNSKTELGMQHCFSFLADLAYQAKSLNELKIEIDKLPSHLQWLKIKLKDLLSNIFQSLKVGMKDNKADTELYSSSYNKFEPFVFSLSHIFNISEKPLFKFKEILNNTNKIPIFLINNRVSDGGEDNCILISSTFLAQFCQEFYSFPTINQGGKRKFHYIVEELPAAFGKINSQNENSTTIKNIVKILNESRKFGIKFTFITQTLNDIRGFVPNLINVNTNFLFRVSSEDKAILSPKIGEISQSLDKIPPRHFYCWHSPNPKTPLTGLISAPNFTIN